MLLGMMARATLPIFLLAVSAQVIQPYISLQICIFTQYIITIIILFVYPLPYIPVTIACSAIGILAVEITCEGIDPLLSLQCSFSGRPLHSCEIC